MKELIAAIENLKKSEVKKLVDSRVKEFETVGKKHVDEIFSELCFCIMTANFNAERSMKIQNEVKNGFCYLPEKKLLEVLEKHGHRFPSARSSYIVEGRKNKNSLADILKSSKNENKVREWVAKNIKGLGYKEASHFLRNIGYKNLAIIDFHIIDLLVKHKLIERPKTLTAKKYLEIEELLKKIASEVSLNLAELDLYLWYLETGKVLK